MTRMRATLFPSPIRRTGAAGCVAFAVTLASAGGIAWAQVAPLFEPPVPPLEKGGQLTTNIFRTTTMVLMRVLEEQIAAAVEAGRPVQLSAYGHGGGQQSADALGPQWASAALPNEELAQMMDDVPRTGGLGAWATVAGTWLENDKPTLLYDGTTVLPLFGLDYVIGGDMVVGAAVGYEGIDLDTDYNMGELTYDGFTIAPYFGKRFGDLFLLDASVGYSRLYYDQDGIDDTDIPFARSFTANRYFGFTSLTALAPTEWLGTDRVALSAQTGFRYVREDQEDFAPVGGRQIDDDTPELGQVSVGVSGSYYFSPTQESNVVLEAFASGIFNYDAIQSETEALIARTAPTDDRTEVVAIAGLNADFTESLSANLEYNSILFREDFTSHTVLVGLRYAF